MKTKTALDQSDYINTPRFTDDEWDWLVTAGSDLVKAMILNSVRISRDLNSNTCEEIVDWLKINATDFYYIKLSYQIITVYFAGAVDKDAFERMVKSN